MKDNKENMETTAESVEKVKTSKGEVKTFTRDEVNKIVNAETNKALAKYKEQMETEKLAKIKREEKLQYQLQSAKSKKENAITELNAYKLKKEASEKGLELSLLNLINLKTTTVEKLNINIDNISIVFNELLEKAVNEKLK